MSPTKLKCVVVLLLSSACNITGFGPAHASLPFLSTASSASKSTSNRQHVTPFLSSRSTLENEIISPESDPTATSNETCIGMSKVLANDADFIKPELDTRQYRSIRLPSSNLQVLLVSDSETDIEAASVHIRAGHFNDPPNRAGLAHFHEHMLFLGTEKYPDESEFEAYLGKNGGSSNAYTDMEDTNYYFNVAPLDHDEDGEETDAEQQEDTEVSSSLSGALDRFSQFFIAPLFKEDSVERELKAIDSEYLNGITSDSWKNFQLLKSSSNASHPFTKFGCGNYNTLTDGGNVTGENAVQSGGSSPRDDLIKFWEDNYVAEKMRVSVVGRASLDELQKVVEKTFAGVRSSHQELQVKENTNTMFKTEHATYGAAFGQSQLGILREVIPVKDSRSLKLYFATPPVDDPDMKETRPGRVLSHLLGHESPGSLHSLLLDEGLINGLSSGVGISASDFSLDGLSLSLTPKGMAQRDLIISLVWQWIHLVRSVVDSDPTLMSKYHDELCQVSKNNFRFRENGNPTDFCSGAAELLFDFEPSKILIGSAIPSPYDSEIAKALMDRFTPENCMISVYDPDLEKESTESNELSAESMPWQTEKWYGAKYRQMNIPDNLKNKWSAPQDIDPRLKLPGLNQFLPTDFSLRADDANAVAATNSTIDYSKEMPKLLVDKPGLRLWHKMDRTFKVPRTSLRLHLASPNVYRSPRSMTLNRLFAKVLMDDLNSFVYDGSIAGCSSTVGCLPSGFSISCSGYSEKLPQLLDVVTSRILSIIEELKEGPELRPGLYRKFKKAQENLLRETNNFRLDSPYETGNYNTRMMIESNVWHVDTYIAELDGEYAERDPLTMEECGKTAEESLTKRLSAEFLCMGNIDKEGALKVVQLIQKNFLNDARPLNLEEIPKTFSLKIPSKRETAKIFGVDIEDVAGPLVLQDVAHSETEENCSVEYILQTHAQHEMGFEGVALLELITHIAYNSAFSELRTKQQLGYIVSAFTKSTGGGGLGLAVVVQSSSTLPIDVENRIEGWLKQFRDELEAMPAERIAMEAAAVAAQLLERNMRFGDEVLSAWGEIRAVSGLGSMYNTPQFNRHEKLAAILTVEEKNLSEEDGATNFEVKNQKTAEDLKKQVLELWDKFFAPEAPERRALSSRVYCEKSRNEFDNNVDKPGYLSSYDEVRQLKQFLPQFPTAPYFIKKN